MGIPVYPLFTTSQDTLSTGGQTLQSARPYDEDTDVEKSEMPSDSEVFTLTNGEKVRLTYDGVASYMSKGNNATVVQYGYGPNTATYFLDIDFDSFDAKLTQYKQDMKDYWAEYY